MKVSKADASPQSVSEVLAPWKPNPNSPHHLTLQKALYLARWLQIEAQKRQTPPEKRQQAELDRLIHHPQDKATLIQITDQAFRSHSAHRAVDQFIHILDAQGIPRFFGTMERTMLKGFQSFGGYWPDVAVPLVKGRMQRETANVILPADRKWLSQHLRKRHDQTIRMNVNILGEAILGEKEAAKRLDEYLELLQWPEIEVVSVKISTLCSQLSTVARPATVHLLCERLELLFRSAAHLPFEQSDGTQIPKMVYLDMEEYKDLHLTLDAFMQTLDRPGMERVRAGIVLQAYLPDSWRAQQQLNDWARRRVSRGGSPVTLRIVKGANMEMERVEASLAGWPQAPFRSKRETDANFKRMLHEGFQPENLRAVRLGIASHNIFDVAYALVLTEEHRAESAVQFEMLEGMANHQRRALQLLAPQILLYAPICSRKNFIHAIGYLIRRLDENTGPDNFLRHTFKLDVDSDDWRRLESGFIDSFTALKALRECPRRTQNRAAESSCSPSAPDSANVGTFFNEPDTDFSLPVHAQWTADLVDRWQDRCRETPVDLPLVIDGCEVRKQATPAPCLDPSAPGRALGHYHAAEPEDVARAVEVAAADPDQWRKTTARHRREELARVAREVRLARADLIGVAMADGGKTILESDPEVSEAVDFLEYYSRSACDWEGEPGLQVQGQGVVVVISPWNFPLAIPCGGIASALAGGNTVIFKPASETVWVAWELCQCFWRAGISKRVLQFIPCSGRTAGSHLVTDPQVRVVVLTGGTETARKIMMARPDGQLLAETGGKNATIVTALADRDQAIKHVMHSAFSHSGQKCSATSLLLLEEEVFEDHTFRETLCDAAASLPVGSAWNLATRIGPLIRPPTGSLETGLKTLESGETWALRPQAQANNPQLWSPGIKWNVAPDSFTHRTELFGPVLGVMRFRRLREAIALVNRTGYGLTSGLESLDDREQEEWQEGIHAGNLYINRPTTGAIVLRQPFGGFGKSAFGPGIKVGGPNYVIQLMQPRCTSRASPSERSAIADPWLEKLLEAGAKENSIRNLAPASLWLEVRQAVADYESAHRSEFSRRHDAFRLVGQDNWRRYLPAQHGCIRLHPEDSPFEILARLAAARVAGCRVVMSHGPGVHVGLVSFLESVTASWGGRLEWVEESDQALADRIRRGETDRIRYAAHERVPPVVWEAAAETGLCVVTSPVLPVGRIELLWYLREQSLSINYHRAGNLGSRGGESRAEPG